MVVCLTSARFNMKADILRQGTETTDDPSTPDTNEGGQWVVSQDPDSGELIRVWQPAEDDPETPEVEGQLESFSCLARGIMEGGIRVAGTTERFGETYDAVDYIKIWFSPRVHLSRRDRITNVRDKRGNVIWMEEETGKPTVFSVTGVIPIIDPFGKHTESTALLERVESQ